MNGAKGKAGKAVSRKLMKPEASCQLGLTALFGHRQYPHMFLSLVFVL